jgi:hypothetical protein
MSERKVVSPPPSGSQVVRKFFDSLTRAQMVDALDLVATDAVLKDEKDHESRGIRAIASSLLPYRKAELIELDRIEPAGSDVRAFYHTKRSQRRRGLFTVDRGRIRAIRLERDV